MLLSGWPPIQPCNKNPGTVDVILPKIYASSCADLTYTTSFIWNNILESSTSTIKSSFFCQDMHRLRLHTGKSPVLDPQLWIPRTRPYHQIRSCLIAKMTSPLNFASKKSNCFGGQRKIAPFLGLTLTQFSTFWTSLTHTESGVAHSHGQIFKKLMTKSSSALGLGYPEEKNMPTLFLTAPQGFS